MVGYINRNKSISETLELLEIVFEGNIQKVQHSLNYVTIAIPKSEDIEIPINNDYPTYMPVEEIRLKFKTEINCLDGVIRTAFCERLSKLYVQVFKMEDR